MKPIQANVLKPIEVLLVEDDPVDVELIMDVLEDSKLFLSIKVVEDGVEALNYLKRKNDYSDASKPDLILLDLNLPKKDGKQTLQEIKQDDNLKNIPVVILTTSTSDEDMLRSHNLGAHGYATKPARMDQFIKMVQNIDCFWFTIAKVPVTEDDIA